MPPRRKFAKRSSRNGAPSTRSSHKLNKNKGLRVLADEKKPRRETVDPAFQQQLHFYEEGLRLVRDQKLHRAKQTLERALEGPGKELADRARVHLRACEQRINRPPEPVLRSAEDHYTHGVAMMNLGRWDEARVHLERARKAAPKADHIIYAMAVLDCLTGEAEAAMKNLRAAIQLRAENRYRARNDEDFAFLQEDPRFTELLYPEREGTSG